MWLISWTASAITVDVASPMLMLCLAGLADSVVGSDMDGVGSTRRYVVSCGEPPKCSGYAQNAGSSASVAAKSSKPAMKAHAHVVLVIVVDIILVDN